MVTIKVCIQHKSNGKPPIIETISHLNNRLGDTATQTLYIVQALHGDMGLSISHCLRLWHDEALMWCTCPRKNLQEPPAAH